LIQIKVEPAQIISLPTSDRGFVVFGLGCSAEAYALVGLNINFGLAAKAPKRDGCHGCRYSNFGKTNHVGSKANEPR
jgi:hypothetical protein